jgi:hypothetical protein
MNRREFSRLIASSIAWLTVAQTQKTMAVTAEATTNRIKGADGKTKAKSIHRRHGTRKRPQNDRGNSNDYVYGKVHYRLKPAK